jgi:hypothetical protein
MTGRTEADIEFIEALRDGFLIQHVDRPTRGRGSNNPSLLDLVLTKEHTATPTVEYHQPLGKSDHSILDIRIEMKQSETFIKTIPNYNRGNFDRMRRVLSDVDWEEGLGREETTQKKWELFHKTITNAVNRCVPKIKIKRKVLKNIPVDNKTLTKIRRKKRLWKQYLETGNQTIYHDYCRTKNQVWQLTRKNMRELEKNIAKEAKTNPKKFWAYANKKTKYRETIPQLLKTGNPNDGMLTENNQEKA